MSLKIYTSGPISGLEPGEARINFRSAGSLLTASGFKPIDPHDIGAYPDNECAGTWDIPEEGMFLHSWECYLRFDIIEMLTCDGIALLDGWEESRGARLEYNTAKELAMEVHTVSWWLNRARLNVMKGSVR